MAAKFHIRLATETAISDGRKILAEMSAANGKQHGAVDPESVAKWMSDCRNLMRLIGDKAVSFAGNGNRKGNHFGRRKGARSAIEKGTTCLTRY
jgi:hypothetical protein